MTERETFCLLCLNFSSIVGPLPIGGRFHTAMHGPSERTEKVEIILV